MIISIKKINFVCFLSQLRIEKMGLRGRSCINNLMKLNYLYLKTHPHSDSYPVQVAKRIVGTHTKISFEQENEKNQIKMFLRLNASMTITEK